MKEKNIEIYKDTLEKSKRYKEGISWLYNIKNVILKQNEGKGNITVVNSDTVSTANLYSNEKTAILNMASYKRPGGGVANGANAQEECLFRCSNLTKSINEGFYPLNVDEAIYTEKAIFFKNFTYDDIKPFEVDVITIAAVNIRNGVPDDYEKITKNKIEFIFKIASNFDVKNLILGAFGCGVFKNNPNFIANCFKESIKNYKNNFNEIVFAIINDKNSVDDNYKIFKNTIMQA